MGKLLIYRENRPSDSAARSDRGASSLEQLWSNGRIEFVDPRLRVVAELRAECRELLAQTRRLRQTMCDRRTPGERRAELRQKRLALRQLRLAIVTLRNSASKDLKLRA